jgi:hypothetical protein
MLTVTTVFPQAKSESVKVISYRCQKCKASLGWPRQRRRPKHFASHFQIMIAQPREADYDIEPIDGGVRVQIQGAI